MNAPSGWFILVVVAVLFYIVGAKYPQYAAKIGLM